MAGTKHRTRGSKFYIGFDSGGKLRCIRLIIIGYLLFRKHQTFGKHITVSTFAALQGGFGEADTCLDDGVAAPIAASVTSSVIKIRFTCASPSGQHIKPSLSHAQESDGGIFSFNFAYNSLTVTLPLSNLFQ